MLNIYYANRLDLSAKILGELIKTENKTTPLQQSIILSQSVGMEKWLNIQIAKDQGIVANINHLLPARFFWQQYEHNIKDLPETNLYAKQYLTWILYNILPKQLKNSECEYLNQYLGSDYPAKKLYHLATTIADLFDQYLIYRPDWILAWEENRSVALESISNNNSLHKSLVQDLTWQKNIWQAIVKAVKGIDPKQQHRATLHQKYIELLTQDKIANISESLYIVGISSLPPIYFDTLAKLSRYTDINLFFTNPCRYYWGNLKDEKSILQIKQRTLINYYNRTQENRYKTNIDGNLHDIEELYKANSLLANFGKQGREFFCQLQQLEDSIENSHNLNDFSVYIEPDNKHLLGYIQSQILEMNPPQENSNFNLQPNDLSLSFHNCHSMSRELEVLHDWLLQIFSENPELKPQDIVIMMPNIDEYAPYIKATFNQYPFDDNRYIPYSIADHKFVTNDVIINSILDFLKIPQLKLDISTILDLLNVTAIQEKFSLTASDLDNLKYWLSRSQIRSDLNRELQKLTYTNYNSWKTGLERLLLSGLLPLEYAYWQDHIAVDINYAAAHEIIGNFLAFIEKLQEWQKFIQGRHTADKWILKLNKLLSEFYNDRIEYNSSIIYLKQQIEEISKQLTSSHCNKIYLDLEIIHSACEQTIAQTRNNNNFLRGEVNFCSLLPMRAIPFKIVCLLGMNYNAFPRNHVDNSFNLMQYNPRVGDRNHRDDDLYLFLETILAAEKNLYISYIGMSQLDNEEKEPSVLISKLLDTITKYINKTITELESVIIFKHSMNIFNKSNFQKPYNSYAKEWLLKDFKETKTFIQNIKTEVTTKIELTELIKFIQQPLTYFYQNVLKINYQFNDAQEDSNEIFKVNSLESYKLKDKIFSQLLKQKLNDNIREKLLKNLRAGGYLPLANFAEITFNHEFDICLNLYKNIYSKLEKPIKNKYIELTLNIENKNISLYGEINNLYNIEGTTTKVSWRFGKIRTKDIIEAWLNFILLNYDNNDNIAVILFDKNGTEAVTFEDTSQISNELENYILAYLQSQTTLQPIPSELADLWFQKEIDNLEDTKQLESLYKILQTKADDLYWQRVLAELNDKTKIQRINQTMEKWFGPIKKTFLSID